MKTQPPAIPDEKLFRALLVTPRPKRLLNFKVGSVNVYAQALASSEIADFTSKYSEYAADIISASLVLASGKRAFSSGASICNILSVSEFKQLSEEVYLVLAEISPMLNTCDYPAWKSKLESGADHHSNFIITQALGGSLNFTVMPDRMITHDHPEWYFGVARNELLDCHWMAYWAARAIYKGNLLNDSSRDEEAFINANKDTIETATKQVRGSK